MMKKISLFFVLLFFSASLFAQTIQELVFFGDSLTDNGNLYNSSFKFIPKDPPYYKGRFTNGPVWADLVSEYFNEKYGTQAQNYAVGGATVVSRSIFDGALPYYLEYEVNHYLKSKDKMNKEGVVYLFWIGANDYMDEKKQPVDVLVNEVVDEIVVQVREVIEHGGKNFVLIDLPDLSKAPYAKNISQEMRDRLRALTQVNHNKLLDAMHFLQKLYPTVHFIYIDTFNIFNDMYVNMPIYNQKYHKHIVNLTDSCWLGGYRGIQQNVDKPLKETIQSSTSLTIAADVGMSKSLGEVPCKNPDDYLFWDSVHPAGTLHEIFANLVIEAIEKKLA